MKISRVAIGLHIWATLWALGPSALFTVSLLNDWSLWAQVLCGFFFFAVLGLYWKDAVGRTFSPFNGQKTAFGFLLQMLLLAACLWLNPGLLRSVLAGALAFFNILNFQMLNRAVRVEAERTASNSTGSES